MSATTTADPVLALPSLVSFWDFQEPTGSARLARGPRPYALRDGGTPVARVDGGLFGAGSARFAPGGWLRATHAEAPGLDLRREVTLLAWLRREPKEQQECQAVAGRWLETGRRRQYCLFLDLRIHGSAQQAALHVSSIGGPTPGHQWCMDAAIGSTPIPLDRWTCIAGTFADGEARMYVDGRLDQRPGFNPYPYPGPLLAGDADFTVGAVHRGGGMGNWFTGQLGGLAVCDRALAPEVIAELARATLTG